jgi:hypothetical protein
LWFFKRRAVGPEGSLALWTAEASVGAEAGPSPRWRAAPSESDRILKRRGRIPVDPLAVTNEHVFGREAE